MPRCPAGKRLCGDQCLDDGAATQSCPCPSGKHRCGDRCLDDALPSSCGQRCEACPLPANATATCVAGICNFACAPGYHRCGEQCLPDGDAGSCGSRCTPCEIPSGGGSASCVAGACKPSCPPDRQLCGGACLPLAAPCNGTCAQAGTRLCGDGMCRPNDVDACGASCAACRPPAFGTATCDGSSCGFVCQTGYQKCGNACISRDSCCTVSDCRPPANADATCSNGLCEWTCKSSFVRCDGTCIATSQCCNADSSIDIDTNGTADCKQTLFPNSQFKRELAPWTPDFSSMGSWSPMDARGDASSGSAKITNTDPDSPSWGSVAGSVVCVPNISPNTTYKAHADYFIPSGQGIAGTAHYQVVAYDDNDCKNTFLLNIDVPEFPTVLDKWTRGSLTFTTPAGTKALWIRIEALKWEGKVDFSVYWDNVLLTR
jgi:hypothetical protein